MCTCTCIKVQISMPDDLIEAVRTRTGTKGFSQYIADAVARRHQHDLLGELIDEFEAEFGPIPPEVMAETAREWPDYDDE